MGQVYLGVSRGGRLVAVKVVRPELADDADFRRRFAREVTAARAVAGFYTAPVVDADPDADPPWLVTAYISGPTLYEAVQQQGPFRRARSALSEQVWPKGSERFTPAAWCTATSNPAT
ncbi:hypothetical protein [Saccharopolyspora sp. NPDC002376]